MCEGSFIALIDLRNSRKRCSRSTQSDLEHFLLLSGIFMSPSENLHRLYICSSHYDYFIKARRKNNCELCKVVRHKSTCSQSMSSLRALPKSAAVALWIARRLSCYYYWTCTECRHYIERTYMTDEAKKFADQLYSKIYDDFDEIVMTPVISPMSSPSSEYQPSFEEISSTDAFEMMRELQHLLRAQHFDGRIEKTDSYTLMKEKSQRTFRRQTKEILLHITKILMSISN